MFALILTLCFSDGNCYDTAPALFEHKFECISEELHIVGSGQVDPKNIRCVPESEI